LNNTAAPRLKLAKKTLDAFLPFRIAKNNAKKIKVAGQLA
jgi:hypothetical protein